MNYADLLLISHCLRAATHEFIIPADAEPRVSPGELRVTDYLIDKNEPVRIRQIVAHCQLAQSRVSTVVQALQRRGWVEVTSDPADRRSTLVRINPKIIRPTRNLLTNDARGVLDRLLESVSAKDRAVIERGLTRLAQVLRAADDRRAYSVQ